MKKLDIHTPQYEYLENDFRQWLDTLGYSETAIKNFPHYAREMFHHLENEQGIRNILLVKPIHINRFVNHLYHRRNERTGAALSAHSINHIITGINLFAQYLQATGKHTLDIAPRRAEPPIGEREILTIQEVKEIYEATFETDRYLGPAMGQRDRAILAVFYGCGLRKGEGEHLNIGDVELEKGALLVRKGKGHRERYVPIAGKHIEDLRSYLHEGREWFTQSHQNIPAKCKGRKKTRVDGQALFLGIRGERMKDGTYERVKRMVEKAGIQKQIGLHSLRHSIATHLLQAGMPLEEISRFLGHSTLESTQIYTHIAHALRMKELEESGQNITGSLPLTDIWQQ